MPDIRRVAPGLVLALALALLSQPIASALGGLVLRSQGIDPATAASPVSAIPVAVILGLVVANTIGVAAPLRPGLDFSVKKVLRLGIILVGIKLSVLDVLEIGLIGVPLVAALVAFAILVALLLASRMGVGIRLGLLAAASTAICGITATVAVAPAIGAEDKEVAYTVANVTLFGLCGMLAYPYLAHLLFDGSSGAAGLFLGTAIHDTSQVMGAAIAYAEIYQDERAMQVATVAKLTRNALLVVVVPLITWLYARQAAGARTPPLAQLFPTFVLGFVALSIVRSVGDAMLEQGLPAWGLFDAGAWKQLARAVGERSATIALATALAAVGLTTDLRVMRGLGPRPFLVGFGAALAVGAASATLASLFGGWIG